MSVAIQDAEGDYGAVVVSNANNHITLASLSDDALWQQVSMLLLQNEVPEAVNHHAAAEAKKRGIRVCLNAAPARPLTPEMLAGVDLLVVNAVEARDLSQITVADLSAACLAAESLGRDFPAVVVTAGNTVWRSASRGQTASRCLPAKCSWSAPTGQATALWACSAPRC